MRAVVNRHIAFKKTLNVIVKEPLSHHSVQDYQDPFIWSFITDNTLASRNTDVRYVSTM